jgi:LysR family transcriptional regulator (chromosome initiation inhibitor)
VTSSPSLKTSTSTRFTAFGQLSDALFDIRIEHQDHSARPLRDVVAMGAVTTRRTPVPGWRTQSLGVMRYLPMASAAYAGRHFPDGFSRRGSRCGAVAGVEPPRCVAGHVGAQGVSPSIARPTHFVPTRELADGSFVRIPDVDLDIPLFWQCWKPDSPMARRVTDVVRSAAAERSPVG